MSNEKIGLIRFFLKKERKKGRRKEGRKEGKILTHGLSLNIT